MRHTIMAGALCCALINASAVETEPPRKFSPVVVNDLTPSPTRSITSLNGAYEFADDPDGVGEAQGWHRGEGAFTKTVVVPGCLQAQGLRGDQGAEFRSVWKTLRQYEGRIPNCWYRLRFDAPAADDDGRWRIKFGGVHPGCKVWLNGQLLGSHAGAFIPFGFDVSDILLPDKENLLVVMVDESIAARALGGHFNKYGGLWSGVFRDVELERAPSMVIEDIFIRTATEPRVARIDVRVEPTATGWVGITIERLEDREVLARLCVDQPKGTIEIPVPDAPLWSPDSPELCKAIVSVGAPGNEAPIDTRIVRFGMREMKTDDGQILVNGKPFYLRGFGDIYCYPTTYSPPTDRDYYRRELELARDSGFNYVRHHSWVPTPEYLDAADEVGVFVQVESASIGQWSAHNTADSRIANWEQSIRRVRNHPSVMTYCMGNEGAGQIEDKKRMREIAKDLDPTRFVISTAHHESKPNLPLCDIIETNKDVYVDKPYFRHEYGHMSSFPDVSTAGDWTGFPGGAPYWITEPRERLEANGLLEMAPTFVKHSCLLQDLTRRYAVEFFRLNKPNADGYTLWLGKDSLYNMGLWDDFGRVKSTPSAIARKSNGPTALLIDARELERAVWSGEAFQVGLHAHHTGSSEIVKGRLTWRLTSDDSASFGESIVDDVDLAIGERRRLTELAIEIPEQSKPIRLKLSAMLKWNSGEATNSWDFCAFPPKVDVAPGDVLIADRLSNEVFERLASGGRVLLTAKDVFAEKVKSEKAERIQTKWATFMTPSGYFGGQGHTYGTIVADHPALGDLPHDGSLDFGSAGLLRSAPAIILQDWPVAIDPIVRAIDHWMSCRSLGFLFEVKVGEGRLLVCSLTLDEDRPDCSYLRSQLIRYANGDAFDPKALMTLDQLRAAPMSPNARPVVSSGFNPTGTWIRKTGKNSKVTIRIAKEGTFTSSSGGSGAWRVEGGELLFWYKDGGKPQRWTVTDHNHFEGKFSSGMTAKWERSPAK